MKSIKGECSVACPNGCEPFDAEFWTLIRGDHDDELKDALLGGEINLVSCPSCGEFFYHDRTIIYFDPPRELLALVSPKADKASFDTVKEQMKKDFETIKKTLTSLNIDYEPFYLSGLEEAKALLEYEDNAVLESEVTALQSAQAGFKCVSLKPSAARAAQFPYQVPYEGDEYTKESALKAAKIVLANNPSLKLLANFSNALAKGAPLPQRYDK